MCELCGDPNIQHLFGEQPMMKPLKIKLSTTTLKKKRKVVTKPAK